MNLIGSCCCVKSREGKGGGRAFAKYKNRAATLAPGKRDMGLYPKWTWRPASGLAEWETAISVNFLLGKREGRKGEFHNFPINLGDKHLLKRPRVFHSLFMVQRFIKIQLYILFVNLTPRSSVDFYGPPLAQRLLPAWSCPAESW